MADQFDPYYLWLGIPPKDQPPNHYRLLGLALHESDADTIENAADRQMAYLRRFQTGNHSEASQKLLNEIARAKLRLLDPSQRAAYDAELRQQTKAKQTKPAKSTKKPKRLPTAAPHEQPLAAAPAIARAIHPGVSEQAAKPAAAVQPESKAASTNNPLAILNTPLSEIGGNYVALALVALVAGGVSLLLLIGLAVAFWPRGDVALGSNPPDDIDGGSPSAIPVPPPAPPRRIGVGPRPSPPSPTAWPGHVPKDARLHDGHYYRLYRVALPWRVASLRCAQMEGYLLRIESPSEQAFIEELLRGTTELFWIDCSDDEREGAWEFSNGQPAKFTNWLAGEPNNAINGENFVVVRNSGSAKWNDDSGGARRNFICEWEPSPVKHPAQAAAANRPSDAKSFGASHYKRFDDACSRAVAELRCSEAGGHLARIESPAEQAFVHALLEGGGKAYWIDGTDEIQEGRWRVGSGAAMAFANWQSSQPDNKNYDEHYATIYSESGLWNDAPPDMRMGFVCEWSPAGLGDDPPAKTAADNPPPGDRRLAIPARGELATRQSEIREAVALDEADTREEKALLATRLLTTAAESRDDPVTTYTMLQFSRALAVDAGEIDTALGAVEALHRRFRVDTAQLQVATLTEAADVSLTPSQRGALVERGLDIAQQLQLQEAHPQTRQALDALLDAARKSRDARQIAQITERRQVAEQVAASYADARDSIEAIAKNPDRLGDRPESALAAGRYYSLIQGDWQRGLPLLAAGSDGRLQRVAALEMQGDPDADDQMRMADGWYDAAAAESSLAADRLKARAKFWYARLGGDLPGLDGVKVRKRLSDLQNVAIDDLQPFIAGAVVSADEMDLLRWVDVRRHRITGDWRAAGEGYRVDAKGNHGHLCLPVVPHGDYEMRARFTRVEGDSGVSVVLPIGERRVRLVVCGAPDKDGVGSSGLLNVNGLTLTQNTTRSNKVQIANGREYELRAQVRLMDTRAQITASVDGESFLDWTGPRSALSIDGGFHHLHGGAPTIGIYRGEVVFHEVGMTMRSGLAQRWRAAIDARYHVALYPHHGGLEHVEFSPDGTLLASAGNSNRVVLWNLASELPQRASPHGAGQAYGACFAKDGQTILSASTDKTIRLMNTADLDVAPPRVFTGHEGAVRMAVLSPDGNTAASVSTDGSVRLWDVASGAAKPMRGAHARPPWHVAYSPAGDVIATAGEDQLITLWEAGTLRKLRSLKGHADTVRAVAFSPDGRALASAGWDGTIRIWDYQAGTELARIDAHNSQVEHVVYSPDGKFIASAGRDRTAKIWDVATRQCVCVLPDHGQAVWCVAFSPDAARLATCGPEGVVRIWNLTYPDDQTNDTVDLPTATTATKRTVDLLPLIDPARDKVVGQWERSGRSIVAKNDQIDAGRISVPVTVSGSYSLRASFTRTSGANTVGILLPVGDRQTLLAFEHVSRNSSGLEMIDGAGAGLQGNPTNVTPGRIVNQWRYQVDVSVNTDGQDVELSVVRNGAPLIHWRGPMHEIDLHFTWRITNSRTFGLAVGQGSAEFDELTLTVPEDGYSRLRDADGE